jgi:hypothetical protein
LIYQPPTAATLLQAGPPREFFYAKAVNHKLRCTPNHHWAAEHVQNAFGRSGFDPLTPRGDPGAATAGGCHPGGQIYRFSGSLAAPTTGQALATPRAPSAEGRRRRLRPMCHASPQATLWLECPGSGRCALYIDGVHAGDDRWSADSNDDGTVEATLWLNKGQARRRIIIV